MCVLELRPYRTYINNNYDNNNNDNNIAACVQQNIKIFNCFGQTLRQSFSLFLFFLWKISQISCVCERTRTLLNNCTMRGERGEGKSLAEISLQLVGQIMCVCVWAKLHIRLTFSIEPAPLLVLPSNFM